MYKKHYEERLKYIKLLEAGYSVYYIHSKYGIDKEHLLCLCEKYKKDGVIGLLKKSNTQASVETKLSAIQDFQEKGLTLVEVMLKYDISETALRNWRIAYNQGGEEALRQLKSGRPPKNMGRPKKREPQTELEKLQAENERLRAENALLKKVKDLVEEREARLHEIGRQSSKN